RDVVVLGRGRGADRRLLGGRHAARRLGAGAAPPAAQELHTLRDDLGDVAAVAFLVVVLAGAGRALDVDLPALGEGLAAGLRLLPPPPHVVPLGALLALALTNGPHLPALRRGAPLMSTGIVPAISRG